MRRSAPPTRDANRMSVTPSNRDSIGSWLDVLTSMLSLPEGERLQVRDELEDHLRSRVDDLLITGTPEPEAVRIAVAELGETAELAKLITHAHTRANPRRRIMNIALITVAIAGLSVGGISLSNQQVGDSGIEGASPVVLVDEGGEDRDGVHTFEMGMTSAHGVLREIARAFDRSFSVSRETTNTQSGMLLGVHTQQFAGEMSFEQAIAEFKNQFDEVSGEYHLVISDDSMVYQTVDEHQRSLIVTRVLPSSEWIERHELYDYANSLEKLLSVKHDFSMTSIEVINEAIVVASVPEIHEEILKMVAELDVVIQQRHIERLKKQEAEKHARDVERSKAYERILVRHADIVGDLAKSKVELEENYESIQILIKQVQHAEEFPDDNSVGFDELNGFLKARRGLAKRLLAQIAQDEDRERYLRDKMVETEFLYLFDGLE